MDKNRKYEFYGISKKEDEFEISHNSTVVFKLKCEKCEEIIQYDTALIAREANGLSRVYLPTYIGDEKWIFNFGLICVAENVRGFYYYKKPDQRFNEGLLLLKIETGNATGYWTAIDIEYFQWALTPERAETRRNSLFQIPYTGTSEATILEEFDYLPLETHLIKINDVIHCINCLGGNIYSESAGMILKTLGKVQVEPLPFQWYFRVISEEGESFFTTCTRNEACLQSFGPFYKISKIEFEQEYPDCYFAKNERDEILGMFVEKLSKALSLIGTSEYKIVFNSPVKEAKLIRIMNTDDDPIANWKLTYVDGTIQIFLCSISNKSHLSIFLNLADYI